MPGSFLKNRAPENGALLSVFMGGIKKPEMFEYSDDKIKEIANRIPKQIIHIQTEEATKNAFVMPFKRC